MQLNIVLSSGGYKSIKINDQWYKKYLYIQKNEVK